MKTLAVLLSTLMIVSACVSSRGIAHDDASITVAERAEAIALVRNDKGRGPFILEKDIASVVRAVRLVRATFPAGNDVVSDAGRDLVIQLTDSAAAILARRFPDRRRGDTVFAELLLPPIDRVIRSLGAHRVSVQAFDFARPMWFVRPAFPQPVYTDGMARQFADVPGVRFVYDPTLSIGDWGGLTLSRREPIYTFTFVRKWGDCPSACIHAHTWVFEVDLHAQEVRRLREFGDAWPV